MSNRLSGGGLLLAVVAALCSSFGIVAIKSGLGVDALNVSALAFGTAIYGASVLLGVILIGKYPLSIVYPVTVGLSLAMLGVLSALLLGESVSTVKVAGMALVVLGVLLLLRRPPR